MAGLVCFLHACCRRPLRAAFEAGRPGKTLPASWQKADCLTVAAKRRLLGPLQSSLEQDARRGARRRHAAVGTRQSGCGRKSRRQDDQRRLAGSSWKIAATNTAPQRTLAAWRTGVERKRRHANSRRRHKARRLHKPGLCVRLGRQLELNVHVPKPRTADASAATASGSRLLNRFCFIELYHVPRGNRTTLV